ncbi:hypothetical protein P7C70_g5641, partial [Phenoliferia sp. Uapishka_3]
MPTAQLRTRRPEKTTSTSGTKIRTKEAHAEFVKGPSPFNVLDEDLDLRSWQAWWESHQTTLEDLDFSRSQSEHLSEKSAGEEHESLLELQSNRRLLTSVLDDAEKEAREVDEGFRRGGKQGNWLSRTPQNLWTTGLDEAQREEIFLHCVRLASARLGEYMRTFCPELRLDHLGRNEGRALWSIVSCLRIEPGESDWTHYPRVPDETFENTFNKSRKESPFPEKRTDRLRYEFMSIGRHNFLTLTMAMIMTVAISSVSSFPLSITLPDPLSNVKAAKTPIAVNHAMIQTIFKSICNYDPADSLQEKRLQSTGFSCEHCLKMGPLQ